MANTVKTCSDCGKIYSTDHAPAFCGNCAAERKEASTSLFQGVSTKG